MHTAGHMQTHRGYAYQWSYMTVVQWVIDFTTLGPCIFIVGLYNLQIYICFVEYYFKTQI